jgi:hypothetical protein
VHNIHKEVDTMSADYQARADISELAYKVEASTVWEPLLVGWVLWEVVMLVMFAVFLSFVAQNERHIQELEDLHTPTCTPTSLR